MDELGNHYRKGIPSDLDLVPVLELALVQGAGGRRNNSRVVVVGLGLGLGLGLDLVLDRDLGVELVRYVVEVVMRHRLDLVGGLWRVV